MTDLIKTHTPRERLSHRAGPFTSQSMQPVPLSIGPISGLKLGTETAVSGCLRGLGTRSKLCLFSYSWEIDEPDRAFGWRRDMSSHHKTVQERTDSSARPRKVTVKSTAWTRTNGELSIKGLVGMTISSLVQMIVSEFRGAPCRFHKLGHELRATVPAPAGCLGENIRHLRAVCVAVAAISRLREQKTPAATTIQCKAAQKG